MAKRCKTCGGIYESTLDDGSEYYHVCPPITMVAVQRDGQTQRVPLADLRPTDNVRVLRKTGLVTVLASDVQPDDQRIGDSDAERPNKRDERPLPRVRRPNEPPVLTAEGLGVDEVALEPAAPVDVFAEPKPVL